MPNAPRGKPFVFRMVVDIAFKESLQKLVCGGESRLLDDGGRLCFERRSGAMRARNCFFAFLSLTFLLLRIADMTGELIN